MNDYEMLILKNMAGEGGALHWSIEYINGLDKLVELGYAALTIMPDGVPLYHLTKEGLEEVKGKESV